MHNDYQSLGKHIRLVDTRNSGMVTDRLLGINIDKYFMPSVANVIGTDLSRYKLISKGLFACNPMHVGRDERLPVALYNEDEPAIVSPAYFMFEVIDTKELLPEYLMMWFRRAEFDRICWLKTDGSVRGGLSWDDLGRMELPVPSIDRQKAVIKAYQTITDRIALKRKINDNLSGEVRLHSALQVA
jgi:type I restriction enzyme S subunit